MKKIKLGKNSLALSIITLITIASWVVFNTYRTATMTTISPATREQMLPLSPQINRELINNLKENLSFSEEELEIAPIPAPEPEPATQPSQTTTESAILEEE
jgi:hypothetical protein